MPGVNICNNVVIGAGSIIVKDILEPGVYIGNPAKKISSFNDFEKNVKTKFFTDAIADDCIDYKERVFRHISTRVKNEK